MFLYKKGSLIRRNLVSGRNAIIILTVKNGPSILKFGLYQMEQSEDLLPGEMRD
jgi:hypothetical protein